MIDLIEDYLTAHENAWTPQTMKSERARLIKMEPLLIRGPEALWQGTQHLKPYTRKTMFVRASAMFTWAVEQGRVVENLFKEWMSKNRRLFKNAYTKKTPDVSYNHAKALISTLPCEATREKALQLLKGGLRWSESFTVREGSCFGKGEAYRRVFVDAMAYPYSYSHFNKLLRTIGLTPHDLRKIRATDLARRGLQPADLCKVFGWQSFNTASRYLAPLEDEKLMEVMNDC